MNKKIQEFANKCWSHRIDGTLIDGHLHFDHNKFAKLIAEECAQICGSQADKKNIRNAFDIPVESDIKYPSPEPHWSVESQYNRKPNLPKS